MKVPFSIRHRKLIEQGKFKINLSKNQRIKIRYLLGEFNESWHETTETGYNYSVSSYEKTYRDLLKAYGYKTLKAYVNDQFIEVDNIADFAEGTKSECILDTIELFYNWIIVDDKKKDFADNLNQILKVEQLHIRFIESEFVRLDSEFAESEIIFKANRLLKQEGFDKAHDDFIDARNRLSNGDYAGCIISANNSVESILKKMLDSKNGNQGTLKKLLRKSKLIPDYFNGFLDNFEGFLQASFTIANKSARHGQKEIPKEINKIDEPVACFHLNLVGTLIIFITERYIESKPPEQSDTSPGDEDNISIEDDLPF